MSRLTCKVLVKLSNILITPFFILACSQNTHLAPVTDSQQPPTQQVNYHFVAKGETLYSIAWRYNLDYKKLARVNGISSSYRIYPGQKLHLTNVVTAPVANGTKSSKTAARIKKPAEIRTSRSKKETPKITNATNTKQSVFSNKWIWPAGGTLIENFESNNGLNKGIDIQGNIKEPVISAAAGRVVYSGEGLRGYGKLIIVKHSAKYLSAYAHNHRLLVKEGEDVKQGQKIAEMGSTGADKVKLHFEIRHEGKPVNPLKFLPKR